jgi:hypothetical protein
MSLISVKGIIRPGYGIASEGSLKTQELISNIEPGKKVIVDQTVYRQFPHFIKAGVEGIEKMHPGTINVDISPSEFSILSPDYEVACEWIEGIKETFWLVKVNLVFSERVYPSYVYYPCVSEQHTARNSMIEIISEKIEGIAYGKQVSLSYDDTKIIIK